MGGRRGTRTLDPFLVRAERGTNECPITSQYVAPARGSANVSTRRDTSTAHKLRTPGLVGRSKRFSDRMGWRIHEVKSVDQ